MCLLKLAFVFDFVLKQKQFMSPPHEMGRHIVFSSVVCLSVCLSVRMSVRHTFVSALYLLNPWWDLQITLHKCQVWWDDVQCLCLTRSVQGQGHNLRLNIVWLYFVSALYLLNLWWDLQITFRKCQVWWYDVQCLCLTKVGSRSRSEFKIKHCMTVFHVGSISFEPLVGFTNYSAQMSRMMKWCVVPMFDQCLLKVKVIV